MRKKITYRNELERSVLRSLLWLIGLSCVLFALGLYITDLIFKETSGKDHREAMEEAFVKFSDKSLSYLTNEKNQEYFKNTLFTGEAEGNLIYSFSSHNSISLVKSDIILSDSQGNIIYSTFPREEREAYLTAFNRTIGENTLKKPREGFYSTVFLMDSEKSSYVLSKGIYNGEEFLGFVALYHRGEDWKNIFSEYHFDGVITDSFSNILYASRYSLASGVNKFYPGDSLRRFYKNDERYWMLKKSIDKYEVNIFSLVYYPKNTGFFTAGIGLLLLLGACWFSIGERMAKKMALKKSEDLNSLVDEIKIIRRGDHDHRISLRGENELSLLGEEINRMLDNISSLNEKNTELISLNNIIEMRQLTEQINPHFLYNTLETIRYLVLLEPERAEDLIVTLTEILRYSINNNSRQVFLYEDMEYIKDYLIIQRNRFLDRLTYTIDIEEECNSSIIPKLLLQPIIENSIKHGFKNKMKINIGIRGFMEGNVLNLEVSDNGSGMEEEAMASLERGLREMMDDSEHNGLHNIGRRIYLKYGKKSGMKLSKNEAGGLTVRLSIAQEGKELNVQSAGS